MDMAGNLFDRVVFGPVKSRRMGLSLGVNLMPANTKCCSFDCIYCECGWTTQRDTSGSYLPTIQEMTGALEKKLTEMAVAGNLPDAITFAGNGEPTLHPHFADMINQTLELRDRFAPKAKVTVLSNGSRLARPEVFEALLKVDLNIQKLDAGTEDTAVLINKPSGAFDIEELTFHLARFNGKVIIQTLFLRGMVEGVPVDNTTPKEISSWINRLKMIAPSYVMIYPIDRETPASGLVKVDRNELERIAQMASDEGIVVKAYS
jgi:wyosine [tRNA(Phe)-imidazoG37] synthetase (radical SAM superfamily)